MNCPHCSAAVPDGMRFCPSCGNAVAEAPENPPNAGFPQGAEQVNAPGFPQNAGQPAPTPYVAVPPSQPPMAPPAPSFPDSQIRLAPGETVVRSFPITGVTKSLGFLRGELTVTDARVIWAAHAKNVLGQSRTCRELKLEDINGAALSTRKGLTPLSFFTIILTLIAGLIALALLKPLLYYSAYQLGLRDGDPFIVFIYLLFFAIAGFLIFLRAKSSEVVFALLARSVDVSPLNIAGARGRHSDGFFAVTTAVFARPLISLLEWMGVLDVDVAGDASDLGEIQRMYDEIGAVILDTQARVREQGTP